MSHRFFHPSQSFSQIAVQAGFALVLSVQVGLAAIDSGGGFEALGDQTIWCSIGEPYATNPSTIGNLNQFPGQIIVLYTLATHSEPSDIDQDGDGIADDWEQTYFGSPSANPGDDQDRDGATNLMEYLAGTNPTDPTSLLKLFPNYENGVLSVVIPSLAGRQYRLYFSPDLQTWTFVRSLNGDGFNITHIFNPSLDDPQFPNRTNKSKYFIRIEILKP
jgi:hypothetical protein